MNNAIKQQNERDKEEWTDISIREEMNCKQQWEGIHTASKDYQPKRYAQKGETRQYSHT